MDRLPFSVRIGAPDDAAFVMDSWLMSEREAAGHAEGHYFIRWQKAMQRQILLRPTTCVRVAYPDDDPGTILGWLAYGKTTPTVIYYLFTRYHSRRLGIAKLLLGELANEPGVIYAARPARDFDAKSKEWRTPAVMSRVPTSWRFAQRANWLEP